MEPDMSFAQTESPPDPNKFKDPDTTAKGEPRAVVALKRLETLWFNTGSLCNIACRDCYMESGPTNDRLAYLSLEDVRTYLDEIADEGWNVEEIGFTGGEPFMNKAIIPMLGETLGRGFRALVLTNGMKPMAHGKAGLLDIKSSYGSGLAIRVSMDHYTKERHEAVRGDKTWRPMMDGLVWLAREGFSVTVAGRKRWGETETAAREGYRRTFIDAGVPASLAAPNRLVLFPEMDPGRDVPEITRHCWDILDVEPESVMCASSRMVIKRKGAETPVVTPCTLLPHDPAFEMGRTLREAGRAVKLNHPYCAQFCVLGGASCTG